MPTKDFTSGMASIKVGDRVRHKSGREGVATTGTNAAGLVLVKSWAASLCWAVRELEVIEVAEPGV